jgi:hypothetical protein
MAALGAVGRILVACRGRAVCAIEFEQFRDRILMELWDFRSKAALESRFASVAVQKSASEFAANPSALCLPKFV